MRSERLPAFLVLPLLFAGMLMTPSAARGDAFGCTTVSNNLIQNCDFSGGSYTAQIGAYTNSATPQFWTPNEAFVDYSSYNGLRTGAGIVVQIGNLESEPVPSLSQTFADTAGATYSGSVYIESDAEAAPDLNPFFNILIDGSVVGNLGYITPYAWDQYTFSFSATGSDTITLEANTTSGDYFFTDVAVSDSSSPPATPEPRQTLPLLFGVGVLLLARKQHRLSLAAVPEAFDPLLPKAVPR